MIDLVRPGDKLRMKADAWNRVMAAAKNESAKSLKRDRDLATKPDVFRHSLVVPAYWDMPDAERIEKGDIVKLLVVTSNCREPSDYLADPIVSIRRCTADNQSYYVAVANTVFTSANPIGEVIISGIARARIVSETTEQMTKGWYNGMFRPSPVTAGALVACPTGAFRAVHVEKVTQRGQQAYAVVQFPVADYEAPFLAKIVSGGTNAHPPNLKTEYTFQEAALVVEAGVSYLYTVPGGRAGTAYDLAFYSEESAPTRLPNGQLYSDLGVGLDNSRPPPSVWTLGMSMRGVVAIRPVIKYLMSQSPQVSYLFERVPVVVGEWTRLWTKSGYTDRSAAR